MKKLLCILSAIASLFAVTPELEPVDAVAELEDKTAVGFLDVNAVEPPSGRKVDYARRHSDLI